MRGVLLASVTLVAMVGAMAVSLLKRRLLLAALSLPVAALAVGWLFASLDFAGDDLESLFFALFLFLTVPPAFLLIVLATGRPARPGSWWDRRFGSPSRDAPR